MGSRTCYRAGYTLACQFIEYTDRLVNEDEMSFLCSALRELGIRKRGRRVTTAADEKLLPSSSRLEQRLLLAS